MQMAERFERWFIVCALRIIELDAMMSMTLWIAVLRSAQMILRYRV